MNWWWLLGLPRHQADDSSVEAQAQLERLADQDDEIDRLHAELCERQRINNFSAMVAEAITRKAHGR